MNPWRLWIVLAALAVSSGQAAVIYKWTDSEGVVHFSDQSVPGAEKIYTTSSSSRGAAASGSPASPRVSQNVSAPKKPSSALNYTTMAITSPAPDQTFFGEEIVSVHLALEPSLRPKQTITWHLNGRQLEDKDNSATQLTLQRLDRGTYAIAATILDQDTGESQSTDSVTFFVRQPSELSPLHRKP